MERAVSPVIAVVVLVAVTVVGATAVTTVAMGLEADAAGRQATATVSVSATADGQRITLTHRGGRPIDLRNCTLAIRIDGRPLAHQPPVPYFAAEGFRGTPTGAFNSAGEPTLDPGERATLQLAATNAPHFDSGDVVGVTVRRHGRRVATAQVRAS